MSKKNMDYRWGSGSCHCRRNHSWTELEPCKRQQKAQLGSNKVTTLKSSLLKTMYRMIR